MTIRSNAVFELQNRMENKIALLQPNQNFRKNSAVWYMIAGAVMIGFSSVWVKLAHVTPTIAGFYRVLFGAVFLTVAAAWNRESRWPESLSDHRIVSMACSHKT